MNATMEYQTEAIPSVLGRKVETIRIPAKTTGGKTLCAIVISCFFVCDGTDTEVAGAEPSEMISMLQIKNDTIPKFQSSEMRPFREFCETWLDHNWIESTLATNPSAATYKFRAVIPYSGRNAKDVVIDIRNDVGTALYALPATVGNPTYQIFGYYADMEIPGFSNISASHTFAGVGLLKIKDIDGDFAQGFLDFLYLLGDGTLVYSDIQYMDNEKNAIMPLTALADLIAIEDLKYTRAFNAEGIPLQVHTTKPFETTDQIKLLVTTLGEVKYSLVFKNETTETEPEAKVSQKSPKLPPKERGQPETERQDKPGQPGRAEGSRLRRMLR